MTEAERHNMEDDKSIVKGCRLRNDKAFEHLYTKYAGKLMAVALRYSNDKVEAEDVLQEALIRIFKSIDDFQFKGSFEGWLRKTVVRTALNRLNKIKSLRENIDSDSIKDMNIKVSESTISQLSANELMNMINTLPDGYKLVFNLHAIEGYNHKEIAEMTGISVGTSKSQLSRAKTMLKELLEKQNIHSL